MLFPFAWDRKMFTEGEKEHKIEFASFQPWLQVVSLRTGRWDLRCAQEKGHGEQTIPLSPGEC